MSSKRTSTRICNLSGRYSVTTWCCRHIPTICVMPLPRRAPGWANQPVDTTVYRRHDGHSIQLAALASATATRACAQPERSGCVQPSPATAHLASSLVGQQASAALRQERHGARTSAACSFRSETGPFTQLFHEQLGPASAFAFGNVNFRRRQPLPLVATLPIVITFHQASMVRLRPPNLERQILQLKSSILATAASASPSAA